MTLFSTVIKKIVNNKWMFLSILIGLVLSTAMLSSIPTYTDGVMQKVLIKDLENYQVESGKYPGSFDLNIPMYSLLDSSTDIKDYYNKIDNIMKTQVFNQIDLPFLTNTNKLTMDYLETITDKSKKEDTARMKIATAPNFQDHVKIIYGKKFSSTKAGDAIEVIATEEAVQKLGLMLDTTYSINTYLHKDYKPFNIKLVGIFQNKDKNDTFWNYGMQEYSESFIMDFSMFKNEFLSTNYNQLMRTEWYAAYDYHKLKIANLSKTMETMNILETWVKSNIINDFQIPAITTLNQYNVRQKTLKVNLLVLEMPIMLMLVFYLFMVSQLIIEQDKNEIAVLKSRGAGRNYILTSYIIQGLILCGIALILGPPIGLLLCTIIGSSNGFMEFVQRSALPLRLTLNVYLYAFCACIIFMITMLIPAFIATKTTIVISKQNSARKNSTPFWKKYFIDVLLLLVSCYGLYSYKAQQNILNITRANGMELPIDPLLYLITTLFILSIGMFFLRLFPYIVKLIFWIGRNRWKPAMYSSLLQVSRSGGKNQFIILFLIVTISTGLFSANAARTINTNIEEKEKYGVGSDITISAKWQDNQPISGYESPNVSSTAVPVKEIIYKEPDFAPYTKLSGIQSATKVMRLPDVKFFSTGTKSKSGDAYFLGIIPSEFARVAWFRSDLLKTHWYNYLNYLTKYPTGLLISSSLAKKNSVKLGDTISISMNSTDAISGTVVGIVPYWPSYNPYQTKESGISDNLIVANLNYIQQRLPLRPYEIWLKKAPNALSSQIYKDIKAKNLSVETLKDSSQNIIINKNDPMVQGTNGALTLGFIVNLLITIAGFLIFWIISIKGRTLQFGVLRAMGLSLKEVIKMLISELLFVSGSGIITGIIIGSLSSKLFVPLLQIAGMSVEHVPPFRVTSNANDYLKLYIVLFVMIISGFIILGSIISKINMNQALKLGED